MSTILSTQDIQEKERLDYWNHLVSSNFVQCEITPLDDRPFWGIIHADQLAFIRFSEVCSSRALVRRSQQNLTAISKGYVKILFQVAGKSVLKQDGRTARLNPGEWTVGDCTRPYDLFIATDDCKHLVVSLPQQFLLSRLPDFESMAAHTFSSQTGLGKVTFDFAQSAQREIDKINAQTAHRLAQTLVDLLVTDLRDRFNPSTPATQNGAVTLLEIKSFIHEQLTNPQLSVDLIATTLNISKSYVHFLFREEDTTVSRYIWDARLSKCRGNLADLGQVNRSITEIAFAWGFNSIAHFSRSFKSRYGLSPRAYRHQQVKQANYAP